MSLLLKRPRRLRSSPGLRSLQRESQVHPRQLVLPIFLQAGSAVQEEIEGMPGTFVQSVDIACATIERAMSLGVGAFALFPRVDTALKTRDGSAALQEEGLIYRALAEIKSRFSEAVLIADVALDPYSSDGHDGLVQGGRIVNDATVSILSEMSVRLAKAGADVVAPSDMMDGRVGAMRVALESAGLVDTVIMSYTAKYASAFYGPFRGALESAPVDRAEVPADKRTYQMDPANRREALIEAQLDVEEGADVIMVKPGLPYLDVVHRLSSRFDVPVAVYHVSGEYAMLKVAAKQGLIDYEAGLRESLGSFVRAGASIVLTYGAVDYAQHYREEMGYA